MKRNALGRVALTASAAAGVLSLAACDPGQQAREVAAHNAKVEQAEADDKIERQANFSTVCISALRWKKGVIAGAGVGSVDVYTAYYRGQLEKTLGDAKVPAKDGAPELSKANADAYLDWAYEGDVKKFTNGGTNGPGNARLAACIQQAAEAGIGPLAGKDKTGRMFKMKAFSERLARSK